MENTRWKKLTNYYDAARMIFVSLLIVIVLHVIISGLVKNKPLLQPFKVPTNYVLQGYTGELMRSLTLDKYIEITQEVFKNEDFQNFSQADLDLSQSIDEVSGMSLNFNAIINIIRKEFGFERNEINIDITQAGDKYWIFIKFPGKLYRKIELEKNSSQEFQKTIEEITEKIAFEFIMDQSPELLIRYMTRINYNLKDYENYIQKTLNLLNVDKVGLYCLWAQRLRGEESVNTYDSKSYRKTMEAVDMDSTRAEVWASLADHYWGANDHEKAHQLLNKAIGMDPTNSELYDLIAQYYVFVEEDFSSGLQALDLSLKYSTTKDRSYYLKGIVFANMEDPEFLVFLKKNEIKVSE